MNSLIYYIHIAKAGILRVSIWALQGAAACNIWLATRWNARLDFPKAPKDHAPYMVWPCTCLVSFALRLSDVNWLHQHNINNIPLLRSIAISLSWRMLGCESILSSLISRSAVIGNFANYILAMFYARGTKPRSQNVLITILPHLFHYAWESFSRQQQRCLF